MTPEFFDIRKAENELKKKIEKYETLSKGAKNVYIFGAGVYAKRFTEFLNSKGIEVKGYVVDDGYDFTESADNKLIHLSETADYKNVCLFYGLGGGYNDFYFEKTAQIKKIVSKFENVEFVIPSDYWMEEMGYTTHEILDIEYIKEHIEEFKETFDMLEDDYSKRVMTEYLYAAAIRDAAGLASTGTAPEYDYDMDLLFDNIDDGLIIECGAFDGESIVQMSEYTGNKYDMLALECDEVNFNKCCDNTKNFNNIKVFKLGVWDKKTKLALVQSDEASYLKEVTDDSVYDEVVEVTDVDSLIGDKKTAALIMDIEGSELKALTGAKNVIKSGANLAVRVYHRKADLFTIPQYIRSLNANYKFYVRFNKGANLCRMGDETTLYAICK